MSPRNLQTSLRRRRRQGCPMADYDRLPAPVRRWLAEAALPWSARSVRRLWDRALAQTGGDVETALHRLCEAERQRLKKDAPRIWGASHPAVARPSPGMATLSRAATR